MLKRLIAPHTPRKSSTALTYKLYLKVQTLLPLTATQTPRKPSAALSYKLYLKVQTLLRFTAPQTPRKPSAARGRCPRKSEIFGL
ncbi:MAG: hypothetical protein ABEH81_11805, partial [Halopenitus sp.]